MDKPWNCTKLRNALRDELKRRIHQRRLSRAGTATKSGTTRQTLENFLNGYTENRGLFNFLNLAFALYPNYEAFGRILDELLGDTTDGAWVEASCQYRIVEEEDGRRYVQIELKDI